VIPCQDAASAGGRTRRRRPGAGSTDHSKAVASDRQLYPVNSIYDGASSLIVRRPVRRLSAIKGPQLG